MTREHNNLSELGSWIKHVGFIGGEVLKEVFLSRHHLGRNLAFSVGVATVGATVVVAAPVRIEFRQNPPKTAKPNPVEVSIAGKCEPSHLDESGWHRDVVIKVNGNIIRRVSATAASRRTDEIIRRVLKPNQNNSNVEDSWHLDGLGDSEVSLRVYMLNPEANAEVPIGAQDFPPCPSS